uniref:Transmembrane protein n=1 Tax=Pithovirus LCPAC304 TaxID=2506594 RepID=A0A481Z8F3_9VIRU|nr:MAG: hypothetical protein LCPAC304_02370 [Pithovirus LCPAC304]
MEMDFSKDEIDSSNNEIHISPVMVGLSVFICALSTFVAGLLYLLNVSIGYIIVHLLFDWNVVCDGYPWYKLWGGCFLVALVPECAILFLLCCTVIVCIGTTKVLKKYGIHIDWEDCNKEIPV